MNQISVMGEWALLEAHWPGCAPTPIGILLRDGSRDRLYVKIRPEWWRQVPDFEERELWRELAEDLEQQAEERGAGEILEWLESTASHMLRIRQRREIPLTTTSETLHNLYQQHVEDSCRQGMGRVSLWLAQIGNYFFSGEQSYRLRVNSWWAQAAVAVALLLTAAWVAWQDHSTHARSPIHSTLSAKIQETSELPLVTDMRYRPVLWNFDTKMTVPPPARRPRKPRRVVAPYRRKQFRLDHDILVRPRVVQLAHIHLPAPSVAFEPRPAAWVPNALESLPAPKLYRARRNKVVHTLALLTVPFRWLTR